jgi:hypothetical protein
MFFVDGLAGSDMWVIGDLVGRNRGNPALARADLASRVITEVGLVLDPDAKGHSRHVNVKGWPTSKDEQKALALEFCSKSTLVIRHP